MPTNQQTGSTSKERKKENLSADAPVPMPKAPKEYKAETLSSPGG